jgi:hypothetical protein
LPDAARKRVSPSASRRLIAAAPTSKRGLTRRKSPRPAHPA